MGIFRKNRKKMMTSKKYAILGLGRFGIEIAKNLSELGCEILAVDQDREALKVLENIATYSAEADIADEGVLRDLDIQDFDGVIVAVGDNLQSSIMCTQICKELGAKYIVAKAKNETHAKILEKLGADKIVFPEVYTAQRLATVLFNPNINELVEMEDGYSIAQISLPESWEGKNIIGLDIRKQYDLNILFVISAEGVLVPTPVRQFVKGDKVVLGGLNEVVTDFLTKEVNNRE